MSNHVPGNREFCAAAGTLNSDLLLALEEFIRLRAPGSEDRQDAVEVASTIPTEATGFQKLGFFDLLKPADVSRIDGGKPLGIIAWLGGEEDKGLVRKAKGPPRALFGTLVELFNPFEGISGVDLQ